MSKYLSPKDFDWLLLALVLAITGVGIMQIYSTTYHTKFAGAHTKQVYWIFLGLTIMFVISFLDYHALMDQWPIYYLISVGMLLTVLVAGRRVFGSRRWLPVGDVHFQVSEAAKLVIILALAKYFSQPRQERLTTADLAKVGLLASVPMGLILLQPDLGTALTFVPIVVVSVFLGGLRLKHFLVLLVALALALPVGWHYVLKPYQKARLTTFLNPEEDPQKAGYQLLQSKIAVGSGGLWGKGTAKGTQAQLQFLPVPHTDFIFAAFAEEHGFFGVLSALLLYFLVLMRLIHNAQTAPDRAGVFIVMGVVGVLLFHILVNVGMVVGYMPVTGIPLPLMSYGGSATLFVFMSLGLVMNVRIRRFVN